jgi:hypothetical protein
MFDVLKPFLCFDKPYEAGDKVSKAELGPYVSNLLADGFIGSEASIPVHIDEQPTTLKKKALKEIPLEK